MRNGEEKEGDRRASAGNRDPLWDSSESILAQRAGGRYNVGDGEGMGDFESRVKYGLLSWPQSIARGIRTSGEAAAMKGFGGREAANKVCELIALAAEANGMRAMQKVFREEDMREKIGRIIEAEIIDALTGQLGEILMADIFMEGKKNAKPS